MLDLPILLAHLVNEHRILREGEAKPEGPCQRTASNILFPLLRPRPDLVRLWDIAISSARQKRFAGHLPWSNCQHQLLTATLCRHAGADLVTQLKSQIHDAGETYTNDVTKPMQIACANEIARMQGFLGPDEIDIKLVFDARKRIDAPIERAIRTHFGLPITDTPEEAKLLKDADNAAAEIELLAFGTGYPEGFRGLDDLPLPDEIKSSIEFWASLGDHEAARCFVSSFEISHAHFRERQGRAPSAVPTQRAPELVPA